MLGWLLLELHRTRQQRLLWLIALTALCFTYHTLCVTSIIATGSFTFDHAGIINRIFSPAIIPTMYLCYAECIGRKLSRRLKVFIFSPSVLLFLISFIGNTPLPTYLNDSDASFHCTIMFSLNDTTSLGWSITEMTVLAQAAWCLIRMQYDYQALDDTDPEFKNTRIAIFATSAVALVIALKALVGCHVWITHKEYALLFFCLATYIYCKAMRAVGTFARRQKEIEEEYIEEMLTTDRKTQILEEKDEIQKEAYLAAMSNVEEKEVAEMTHKEVLMLQLRTLIEQEKIYLKAGLKLDDVAITLGTNRTYLSRMMMETYNHTFSEQMNIFRLESAKADMLRRRDVSIESIALSNGFNSANTFNKVFNQHFKCSPANWRNSKLGK